MIKITQKEWEIGNQLIQFKLENCSVVEFTGASLEVSCKCGKTNKTLKNNDIIKVCECGEMRYTNGKC